MPWSKTARRYQCLEGSTLEETTEVGDEDLGSSHPQITSYLPVVANLSHVRLHARGKISNSRLCATTKIGDNAQLPRFAPLDEHVY